MTLVSLFVILPCMLFLLSIGLFITERLGSKFKFIMIFTSFLPLCMSIVFMTEPLQNENLMSIERLSLNIRDIVEINEKNYAIVCDIHPWNYDYISQDINKFITQTKYIWNEQALLSIPMSKVTLVNISNSIVKSIVTIVKDDYNNDKITYETYFNLIESELNSYLNIHNTAIPQTLFFHANYSQLTDLYTRDRCTIFLQNKSCMYPLCEVWECKEQYSSCKSICANLNTNPYHCHKCNNINENC
jgi:hypothetical protein